MRFKVILFAATWSLAPTLSAQAPKPWNDDAARAKAIAEAIARQEERKARLERGERPRDEPPDALPTSADNYSWKDTSRSRELGDGDIAKLGAQKVLQGRREARQIFEFYTAPQVPVFITSDSLLASYHALLEDSFRELEQRRVGQLRSHLERALVEARKLVERAVYPVADTAPSWRQAQLAVGPALVLLGSSPKLFDAALRDEIAAQVKRIRTADGVALPSWLAPETDVFLAIDYRRCRPVGFYADNERLADYFRAVRWLQIVPFRAERDHEIGAIALLGYGAGLSEDQGTRDFFRAYERFLGQTDDPSISDAKSFLRLNRDGAAERPWRDEVASFRSYFQRKASVLNDDLRREPSGTAPAERAPFRVLAPHALPDAVLLQKLIDQQEPVSGLHVEGRDCHSGNAPTTAGLHRTESPVFPRVCAIGRIHPPRARPRRSVR